MCLEGYSAAESSSFSGSVVCLIRASCVRLLDVLLECKTDGNREVQNWL